METSPRGLTMASSAAARPWHRWMGDAAPAIERALRNVLPKSTARPRSIHRAMRYAVFSGGKRIRPGLAVLGFQTAGGRGDGGARLGAAIELLHTFSLIHDDLPCMDDDDYRRGRLTCHKKFGEAIAVLAGDALQVLAFEVLADLPGPPSRRIRVLQEITRAVGTAGVMGGQVEDIEAEGKAVSLRQLRWIHAHKTGALFRCALLGGAILGGARPGVCRRLSDFGDAFGLLFQIVDDALNEVGSTEVLGRERGGDRDHDKATYPSVLGLPGTQRALEASLVECLKHVPVSGSRAAIFQGLLAAVVERLPADWSGSLLTRIETGTM